jgi:hypothetical protein
MLHDFQRLGSIVPIVRHGLSSSPQSSVDAKVIVGSANIVARLSQTRFCADATSKRLGDPFADRKTKAGSAEPTCDTGVGL